MKPKPAKKQKRNYPQRDYTQRLYKKFSQITGVPVKNLMPKIRQTRVPMVGGYKSITHEAYLLLPETLPLDNSINKHELRHGLQNLSSNGMEKMIELKTKKEKKMKNKLKRIKKNFESDRKWIEPTNMDPKIIRIFEAMGNLGIIKTLAAFSPMVNPSMIYSYIYLLPQYIAQIKRQSNARKIFKKYGEDGMLLLWAAPPKKLDALQITEWEKEMVKKGYLKEKKGMTKKGLQYFRKNLQSETIWRKLKKFEKRRVLIDIRKAGK